MIKLKSYDAKVNTTTHTSQLGINKIRNYGIKVDDTITCKSKAGSSPWPKNRLCDAILLSANPYMRSPVYAETYLATGQATNQVPGLTEIKRVDTNARAVLPKYES